MDQEEVAGGKLDEEVLRAAANGANLTLFEAAHEIVAERIAEIRTTRQDAIDARAVHRAMQLPARVFDFGELGHT
jgi:hypothetical protein